jgi:hypothetical protein
MDVIELESEVEIESIPNEPSRESTSNDQKNHGNTKRIGPCSADMFNLLWLGSCLFVVIFTFLAAQVTFVFP